MSAQDLIMGSRLNHVRELKTEVAKLTEANQRLRSENESLKAHFDLALLAAMDLRAGEPLEIWDGWNLILGAAKFAHDRQELLAKAESLGRRVWIVLDGPDEKVRFSDKVRVSYTGGTGEHRADQLITDFVRMAAYLNLAELVSVRTRDRDFAAAVRRLGGKIV